MKQHYTEFFRDLFARFLFPQRCILCGDLSGSGRPLCLDCLETRLLPVAQSVSFLQTDFHRCFKCGRTLISTIELCTTCRTIAPFSAIDRIIPLFPYSVCGQEMLAAWKTNGMTGLSLPYAQCIAAALKPLCIDKEIVIVPVPPRPGKIREKGWDQVDEIAEILEHRFCLPIRRCLIRTNGNQQKKLGKAARYTNLKGCIEIVNMNFVPRVAIIIDDLMTTGSTLDTCASVLKGAGCERVFGMTLFYD